RVVNVQDGLGDYVSAGRLDYVVRRRIGPVAVEREAAAGRRDDLSATELRTALQFLPKLLDAGEALREDALRVLRDGQVNACLTREGGRPATKNLAKTCVLGELVLVLRVALPKHHRRDDVVNLPALPDTGDHGGLLGQRGQDAHLHLRIVRRDQQVPWIGHDGAAHLPVPRRELL